MKYRRITTLEFRAANSEEMEQLKSVQIWIEELKQQQLIIDFKRVPFGLDVMVNTNLKNAKQIKMKVMGRFYKSQIN